MLRRELRERFVGHLGEQGFQVCEEHMPSLLVLRRETVDRVHLLDIQWDKYGKPRFLVVFGSCPLGGIQCRGERIPAERMLASWSRQHGSLQPRKGFSSRCWFRQDRGLIQRMFKHDAVRSPKEVVSDLLDLFPEVEAFWSSGAIGPHLTLFTSEEVVEATDS